MIKIPSVSQIRELDAFTIEEENITSLALMERAAGTVAGAIMKRWPSTVPVVVFAGPGNNGGDALVVARILAENAYDVEAFLINTRGRLSAECSESKERLKNNDRVRFSEVNNRFEPPTLTAGKLVIDGLFGTGLKEPLMGGFASLVKFINDSPATVISIDIPSGLLLEPSLESDRCPVVRARYTFTFQLPKMLMLLDDTAEYWGETETLDIGLSRKGLDELASQSFLTEHKDLCKLLMPRAAYGNKGTFGHALIVAGKYGMAGAAILAAKACLRSGVGKCTIHTPQMNNSILQVAVPEAIMSHDVSDTIFTTSLPANPFDAVCVGPGIGTEQMTAVALLEQITRSNKPLVIDADALNVLGEHPGWINQVPPNSILTPHPLELSRIIHRRVTSSSAVSAALSLAIERNIYIVLKGHHTAVCTPEGHAYFNSTGNSGMATAGSGDVLSGIITSLLAQHYSPLSAAMLGVYVHGLAGDLAAEALSEEGVVASDIIAYLPAAFKKLRQG